MRLVDSYDVAEGVHKFAMLSWDVPSLTWVRFTGGGGGGGGGAVTIADGADVAQGAKSDAAWSHAGDSTIIAALKAIAVSVFDTWSILDGGEVAVTNAYLPALGSTTDAEAAAGDGTLIALLKRLRTLLGLTATDATLTGGLQKAINRGGAKGATVAADITSTAEGADHQALDIQTYHGGAAIDPRDVSDRDARLAGRVKLLDSAGAVIDAATKGQLPATLGQKAMAAAFAVVISNDQTVIPVSDNAGSLTVDAPVGTPLFARLSDGAAALIGQKVAASSLPIVIASDQSAIPVNGDVDHDAVNTLKNIQIAGHASPIDVPPSAVSANGDRVRAWLDRYGASVIRSRKIRESYTAVYRLAQTGARLDQTFTQVANTNKQWGTIHHTVSATKELKLVKCWMYITSDTVAGIQGVFELRKLDMVTVPATGNPAIIPTPMRYGGGAAEAVCLYLPTTQGSEAAGTSGADVPLAHVPFDTGISGAVSTANPVPILIPVVLYDAATEDPEFVPPTLPVGTAAGWGMTVRTVGVPVLRITLVLKFTEEIP